MADLNLLRALLEEELAKSAGGRGPGLGADDLFDDNRTDIGASVNPFFGWNPPMPKQALPARSPATAEETADQLSLDRNASSMMPLDRSTMSQFEQMTPLLDAYRKQTEQANQAGSLGATAANQFANAPNNQRQTGQEAKNAYNSRFDTVVVQPGVLPKEKMEAAMALYQESPEYKSQKDLLGQLDQFYPDLMRLAAEKPVGTDMTPALKLADTFFGSNFASGYKAPQQEDLQGMLTEYFKTKASQRNKMADQATDFLKAVITPGTTLKTLEQLALQNAANVGTQRPPAVPAGAFRYDPQKINSDVQKLGDDVGGFAGVTSIYKRIDDLVGGLNKWSGQEIPGTGLTGLVPEPLLSEKGRELRQLVQSLMNEQIYEKSGAAINNQEFYRLSQALGANPFSSDQALVSGMKNWARTLEQIMSQREKKYRPEVREVWDRRGGLTAEKWAKMIGGGGGVAPKSNKELKNMSDEDFAAYEAEIMGAGQ